MNETNKESSSPSQNQVPYIEIREEFDSKGNEIRSEAINVAQELQKIRKEIAAKKSPSKKTPDDRRGDEQKTTASELKSTFLDSLTQCDEKFLVFEGADESSASADSSAAKNLPSEARYQEISQRLDELILLEEESDRKSKSNVKSSRKIQGTGWGAGFLHQSKKKTTNASNKAIPEQQQRQHGMKSDSLTQPLESNNLVENKIDENNQTGSSSPSSSQNVDNQQQQQKPSSEKVAFTGIVSERVQPQQTTKPKEMKKNSNSTKIKGWNKGFLQQPKKKKSPTSKEHDVKQPTENHSKRVSFSGNDSIQEIPNCMTTPPKQISQPPVSLENTVFTGMVSEKGMEQRQPQQQPPKKKLSRFAMQRQGLLP